MKLALVLSLLGSVRTCRLLSRIAKVRFMLPYRYRTFAVKVAVTAIVVIAVTAVTVGLLYSGMVSNLLPDSVLFGS